MPTGLPRRARPTAPPSGRGRPGPRHAASAGARLAAALALVVALAGSLAALAASAQPSGSLQGTPSSSSSAAPSAAGGRSPTSDGTGETVRILIVNAPADARTGRWDPRAGVWEFDPPAGAVVRVEWGQWQAQARRLRWQPNQQVAELSGEVMVRRPDLEATASRATVSVEDRRARLEGNVRAVQFTAAAGERRPLRTLTAETLELDDGRQVVEARQAVRVEQTDPPFWARGDEMVYNQRTGRLVLTARGGVTGEAQGYRLAQAARLEFHTESGEMLLFGPASLQQVPAEGAS